MSIPRAPHVAGIRDSTRIVVINGSWFKPLSNQSDHVIENAIARAKNLQKNMFYLNILIITDQFKQFFNMDLIQEDILF